MQKTILSIVILIIALTSLQSQDRIWIASGDTIAGEIEILMPSRYYEEIAFDDGNNKKRMKAYEFVGFEKDGERYRSIKNGDVYQVMKLEKTGYLSLYTYRMDQGYNFAGKYILRADGMGIDVPNMGFKKRMSRFLEDCNAVSLGISEGQLKKSDLDKIIDDYNTCIVKRTNDLNKGQTAANPAVASTNSDLVEEAQSLLNEAKSLDDSELSAMLEDVMEKLAKDESVPSYLKNAIQDQVGEDSPLYARIQNFLKKI